MALYAFDGTGKGNETEDIKDSNVVMFFNAYQDANKNEDADAPIGSLYVTGIGKRAKEKVGELTAEAFGLGGHRRIAETIERLERNIAAGDADIDVVGFSRGAALAISFANKLAKQHPALRIRFIGVFDIVGEFGLPGPNVNAGHDLDFASNVDHCYHAMALDEHRLLFPVTRLTDKKDPASHEDKLQEVWFRGVHSDVGGGNENSSLNLISLDWMFQNAQRHGLPIPDSAVQANLARKDGDPKVRKQFAIGPRRNIRDTDKIHFTVDSIDGRNDPKSQLARVGGGDAMSATG